MKRLDESGGITGIVSIALLAVLLVVSLGFGVWAYQGRQDYKNNSDQKVAVAIRAAKQQQSAQDRKQFAELEKQPLSTYKGPQAYGSLVVSYPKTWSSYVDTSGKSQGVVDGYFYPGTVPSITDQSSVFALRVRVLAQAYADVVASVTGQQSGASQKVAPYSFPKVPSVIGVRIDGQIAQDKTGSMVILPLRDKTLEIWTESSQFQSDFNNTILPNLSFSP